MDHIPHRQLDDFVANGARYIGNLNDNGRQVARRGAGANSLSNAVLQFFIAESPRK